MTKPPAEKRCFWNWDRTTGLPQLKTGNASETTGAASLLTTVLLSQRGKSGHMPPDTVKNGSRCSDLIATSIQINMKKCIMWSRWCTKTIFSCNFWGRYSEGKVGGKVANRRESRLYCCGWWMTRAWLVTGVRIWRLDHVAHRTQNKSVRFAHSKVIFCSNSTADFAPTSKAEKTQIPDLSSQIWAYQLERRLKVSKRNFTRSLTPFQTPSWRGETNSVDAWAYQDATTVTGASPLNKTTWRKLYLW